MSFLQAYLRAAGWSATLILVVAVAYSSAIGEFHLADLVVVGPIIIAYTFAVTLLGGVIADTGLRVLGLHALRFYVGTGAFLGALVASFFFHRSDDRTWFMGSLVLFAVAGAVAAARYRTLRAPAPNKRVKLAALKERHAVTRLSNDDLTLEMIPAPDADWPAIANFAGTFDGYEYWGSFERCGAIANARSHRNLTDLRTCLFFEQRRWKHFGGDPDVETLEYLRELLAKIRDCVSSRDLA